MFFLRRWHKPKSGSQHVIAQNSFKQNNNIKFGDNFPDDVDDASEEIDVEDTKDIQHNDETVTSSFGYSGKEMTINPTWEVCSNAMLNDTLNLSNVSIQISEPNQGHLTPSRGFSTTIILLLLSSINVKFEENFQ